MKKTAVKLIQNINQKMYFVFYYLMGPMGVEFKTNKINKHFKTRYLFTPIEIHPKFPKIHNGIARHTDRIVIIFLRVRVRTSRDTPATAVGFLNATIRRDDNKITIRRTSSSNEIQLKRSGGNVGSTYFRAYTSAILLTSHNRKGQRN